MFRQQIENDFNEQIENQARFFRQRFELQERAFQEQLQNQANAFQEQINALRGEVFGIKNQLLNQFQHILAGHENEIRLLQQALNTVIENSSFKENQKQSHKEEKSVIYVKETMPETRGNENVKTKNKNEEKHKRAKSKAAKNQEQMENESGNKTEKQQQQIQVENESKNIKEHTKSKNEDKHSKTEKESKEKTVKEHSQDEKESKEKNVKEHSQDEKESKEKNVKKLEKVDVIGDGPNGRVMKITSDKIYALKAISLTKIDPVALQNLLSEYERIKGVNHPNILQLHSFSLIKNDQNSLLISTEFCPINLEQAIKSKKLTKSQIICIIFQIIEGMKFIHLKGIVHGSLKPTNILFSEEGTVKIGDIGISRLIKNDQQTIEKDSLVFTAPEIINKQECNEKIDVFAFGVLIFYILSGGETPNTNALQIPANFTSLSKQLIEACLQTFVKYRPSFKVIDQQLEKCYCNLLEMSESEKNEALLLISQCKEKIPSYSA